MSEGVRSAATRPDESADILDISDDQKARIAAILAEAQTHGTSLNDVLAQIEVVLRPEA